jgi:superfamily II DNA/RNA helicase
MRASGGGTGASRPGGVNFGVLADRQVGDHRHEREKSLAGAPSSENAATSAAFAAFTRMAAGVEGRRLEDKMSDPNRPTWEQYKKENEDKLLMVGGDMKKMAEYRAQLDRERERKMNQGSLMMKKSNHAISDDEDEDEDDEDNRSNSDDDDSSDDDSGDRKKSKHKSKKSKSKKEKSKKHKKEKSSKHKKSKKRKRNSSDDSDGDSGHNSEKEERRQSKESKSESAPRTASPDDS